MLIPLATPEGTLKPQGTFQKTCEVGKPGGGTELGWGDGILPPVAHFKVEPCEGFVCMLGCFVL